jgi:hypothetical protein
MDTGGARGGRRGIPAAGSSPGARRGRAGRRGAGVSGAGVPGADASRARFALFDATAGFLAALAEARPLVVVLEDLHWADPDSLALAGFAARQLAGRRVLGDADAIWIHDIQRWELARFQAGRGSYRRRRPDSAPPVETWPPWQALQIAEAGDLEHAAAVMAGFPAEQSDGPGATAGYDLWFPSDHPDARRQRPARHRRAARPAR